MENKITATVAITDDHALIRETFCTRLKLLGYHVVIEAKDGQELLDRIAETAPPDICLLDITMPVMDGFATAKHLKRKWPRIKILFFSLHSDLAYVRKALQSGADGFIAKDASSDKLIKALDALVTHGKMKKLQYQ